MSEEFKASLKQERTIVYKKLIECVRNNKPEDLKWLNNEYKLTDKDCRSNDNWALRLASQNGHTEIVKMLLEKGLTDEDCRSNNNWALRRASENCHTDIVRMLLENLTKEDCRSNNNYALRRASENGNTNIVKMLLKKGLTIKEDITEEMYNNIIKNNRHEVLQVLVDNGLTKDTFTKEQTECEKIIDKLHNVKQEFEIVEKELTQGEIIDKILNLSKLLNKVTVSFTYNN